MKLKRILWRRITKSGRPLLHIGKWHRCHGSSKAQGLYRLLKRHFTVDGAVKDVHVERAYGDLGFRLTRPVLLASFGRGKEE
jgi:hypothetical protein